MLCSVQCAVCVSVYMCMCMWCMCVCLCDKQPIHYSLTLALHTTPTQRQLVSFNRFFNFRVGILVFPLAQFWATWKKLGLPLTLFASVVSFIPGVRGKWLFVVAFVYGARAICLELMDPFLGRLKLDRPAAKVFILFVIIIVILF